MNSVEQVGDERRRGRPRRRLRADRLTATGSRWPSAAHSAICAATIRSTRCGQRLHEPGLLGERDELGRRDEAAQRVAPAEQRLQPADLAGAQVDLGLVVHAELVVVVERAPQVAEQDEPVRAVEVALPDV